MPAKRFYASDYALVVRIIDSHLVVTCPDLKLPMPVVMPCDLARPSLVKVGEAIILAFFQIEKYLKDLVELQREHPLPSEPKEVVPALPKVMSMTEACRLSGLKPDVLRTLADQGIIRSIRTAGGHRRFFRDSIEQYQNH